MADDCAPSVPSDVAAVEEVVRAFLAAFTSGPDSAARLDTLRTLFLPQAIIVRTCGGEPTVYDVEGFIAPREAMLTSGTLADFSEWALAGRTGVFGDVAHHFGSYAKAGVQAGTPFTGRGMKSLQLVRVGGAWRISAAAWDDERDGLALAD